MSKKYKNIMGNKVQSFIVLLTQNFSMALRGCDFCKSTRREKSQGACRMFAPQAHGRRLLPPLALLCSAQLFADVWRERRRLQRCGEMSCTSAGLSHRRMAKQPRLVPVSLPQMSHELMSANTRGDCAGARCKLNSCSSNSKHRLRLFFFLSGGKKQVSCGGKSENRCCVSGVLTVLRSQISDYFGPAFTLHCSCFDLSCCGSHIWLEATS